MFDTFQFIFFINKILNHKSIEKIIFLDMRILKQVYLVLILNYKQTIFKYD